VIAGVGDLCPVADGLDNAPDIGAIRVVAVIMDDQVWIFLQNRCDKFADSSGRSQAGMILYAKKYVFTGHIENLTHLADIEFICVLPARGEADGRLQNPAGCHTWT